MNDLVHVYEERTLSMKISLSIKEVCAATGLGRTKIYEAITTGDLPAKKWGKRTLILKSDLEAFISGLGAYSVQGEVRHG
jgi:excisionase family DNA binding protein